MEAKTAKIVPVWGKVPLGMTGPVMEMNLLLAVTFPAVHFAARRPNVVRRAKVTSLGLWLGMPFFVGWELLLASSVESEISTPVLFSEPPPIQPPRQPTGHVEWLLDFAGWMFVELVPTHLQFLEELSTRTGFDRQLRALLGVKLAEQVASLVRVKGPEEDMRTTTTIMRPS